jgi:hypothetical protein
MVVAVILAFILPNVPAAIVLIQVVAIIVAFTFSLVVLFSTPFTSIFTFVLHFFRNLDYGKLVSTLFILLTKLLMGANL